MIDAGDGQDAPMPVSKLAKRETHLDGLVAWCKAALDQGEIETALKASDRAIRLAGKNPHLRLLRGTVLLAAAQPSLALPQFAEARTLGASPDAEIGIALAQLAIGDEQCARYTAQDLLRLFSVVDFPIVAPLVGRICRTGTQPWPGWLSLLPSGELIFALDRSRLRPDSYLEIDCADGKEPLITAIAGMELQEELRDGYATFRMDLRSRIGAQPISVSVDGRFLLGSPIVRPAASGIEGIVEATGSRIRGWLRFSGFPSTRLAVRLRDAAGRFMDVETNPVADWDAPAEGAFDQKRQYFSFDVDCTDLEKPMFEVWGWNTAFDEGAQLTGSPVSCTEEREAAPVRLAKHSARAKGHRPIDIVIPVYRGFEETVACLNSVLAARRGNGDAAPYCDIVVIDDGSPDEGIRRHIQALAKNGEIQLVSNDRNLGFPASVNRGFALHPDRDVAILNSDTLVFDNWLERLQTAAYAQDDIGTVTPLSNNATILSYPRSTESNPVPSEAVARQLDGFARDANAGLVIDIPTAVGFCTYIRRDCLDGTGGFDVTAFGHGYGEENDFCMRSAAAGWRHVAAADVFVAHAGGSSFGASKERLAARNIAVLNRLHPGYDRLIEDFVRTDPLAPARKALDIARMQKVSPLPAILLVTLNLPGGVARHVADSVEHHRSQGRRVFVLKPVSDAETDGRCILIDPSDDSLCNLIFTLPQEMDDLLALLEERCVAALEIHHFLGLDPAVFDIASRLGIPYDVVLHDYSWICPRITLMRDSGDYCGTPTDTRICNRCVRSGGAALREDISTSDLRRRSVGVLKGAGRVVASCQDVVSRFSVFVPDANYVVRPWESPVPLPQPRTLKQTRVRIVIIGAIGRQKGYDILLRCAQDAAERDLPLEFVVVGFTEDDFALFDTGRVFVTGRYEEEEAVALIAAQNGDCVFLPSVSPETWSYALTLAWKAGLEALAFDLGAIAERIRAAGHGRVIPFSADPKLVNRALLEFVGEQRAAAVSAAPHLPRLLSAEIVVHVRNRGDLRFRMPSWAGCPNQNLWIEAFAIQPLGDFQPEDIEYKALMGNGVETPWMSGGAMCGTRGASMPLTAFVIRLRNGAERRFNCTYRGSFLAAGVGKPVVSGEPCTGETMSDPLDGIYLEIFEKAETVR